METQTQEGLYIYCIIKAGQSQSFGALGLGGRGDELCCVGEEPSAALSAPAPAGFAKAEATGIARAKEGGIAAVVSRCPVKKFKMSRDNLLAHERAIEEVMKTYNVLPVRFATVAESEEKVRRILKKENERFLNLLHEMEGRKELGLKAFFKSEAVYSYIAGQNTEIKQMRERLQSMPADKIYFQKMELGRLVENALGKEREKYREEIVDALTPLALDVKFANPYGEMMILNASFLVEKKREQEFDEAVRGLDERLGTLITWHYTGTLPPFNFVNVIISTEDL